MGRKKEREGRSRERERDREPITKGLGRAFHPKTVTTHANVHSAIFFSSSPLHTNAESNHTWSDISLSLTHTHTQSLSSKQMHS